MGVVLDDDGVVPEQKNEKATSPHYPTEEKKLTRVQEALNTAAWIASVIGAIVAIFLIALIALWAVITVLIIVFSLGMGLGSITQLWLGLLISLLLLIGAFDFLVVEVSNTVTTRIIAALALMVGSGVFIGAISNSTLLITYTDKVLSLFVR